MPAIEAVIFDIGRVLVRITTDGAAFGRLMRLAGVDKPEEAFDKFWRQPEVIGHMTGKIAPAAFYAAARSRFGAAMDYDQFVAAWCDIFVRDPAMEELFLRVAARRETGLLSDTDPLHWARLSALVPCLGRVAKPALSFQVGQLKPHPDMFAAALRAVGREAGECLFIDDIEANVLGAERAGLRALRFEGIEKLEGDLRKLEVL